MDTYMGQGFPKKGSPKSSSRHLTTLIRFFVDLWIPKISGRLELQKS